MKALWNEDRYKDDEDDYSDTPEEESDDELTLR